MWGDQWLTAVDQLPAFIDFVPVPDDVATIIGFIGHAAQPRLDLEVLDRRRDATFFVTSKNNNRKQLLFLRGRGTRHADYLLPGFTAGTAARSAGTLSAGNVSTFISTRLMKGQP